MSCRSRRFHPLWVALLFVLGCPPVRAIPWFPEGPDGGDARAIGADPRDHAHLYLGTANGWLYQSRDSGTSWARLARVGDRDDLVLKKILVDPADSRHILVGAYVPVGEADGGIYSSNDGGVTWTLAAEMRGQSVRALTYAPSDSKIVVAGTLEGVFRSSDGGVHWVQISPKSSAEIHEIESLAVDPGDPNIIYAGTWHLPWKTVDGGKNWTNIKQGIIEDSDVFSILIDPKQSNVLYLSACSGIYKSQDAGAKFTGGVSQNKAQGIPLTARRTRVLKQDLNHPDTVFAGTTEGLYRTFDGGKYWIQTTGPDIIVNDVYVDPTDSHHVLLATDRGGVLSSDDGGDSFLPSNKGFSARYIDAFTGDAQHAATIYVGVVNDKEAGGVFVSHTGGLTWSQLSGGLAGRDVFSLGQAPDGTILAGTEHGIYRLKGAVWQKVGDDPPGAAATADPPRAVVAKQAPRTAALRSKAGQHAGLKAHAIAAAPALKDFDGSVSSFALTGETLYAATSKGLLRSASSGLTWSLVESIPMDAWRLVAATKSIVVAASLNAVEISKDGGNGWSAVKLPATISQILALSVDGHGNVWIGDRDGVYYSADKGATWQTPTNLVVRNVNSLYYDEQGDRILVTANEPVTKSFAVNVATMRVTTWDTGWNLRFMRPVGDHLVAATLFDGIVVQPRMVDSALVAKP